MPIVKKRFLQALVCRDWVFLGSKMTLVCVTQSISAVVHNHSHPFCGFQARGKDTSSHRPTVMEVRWCWLRLDDWSMVTQDQELEVMHHLVQLQSPIKRVAWTATFSHKKTQAASSEPTYSFVQFWGTQTSSLKCDYFPIIAIGLCNCGHNFSVGIQPSKSWIWFREACTVVQQTQEHVQPTHVAQPLALPVHQKTNPWRAKISLVINRSSCYTL